MLRVYIYNCLNHGTITHRGTTSNELRLGGIVGNTSYTTTENCVSGGKFSMITTPSYNKYIGSIVGYASSYTSISYTYFTSDLSGYNKYGKGTPSNESNTLSYDSTSFELSETVSIGEYTGTSLIEALNTAAEYYTLRDYSHWLLNKGNKAVSFTINKNSPFTLNTQIILMPNLASDGNLTYLWYTDKDCTVLFEKMTVEGYIALYGKYGREPPKHESSSSSSKYESESSMAPSFFPYAALVLLFFISMVAF